LNIRGAFLHMAADAGISLGVVVAGLAIDRTGLAWIDPVVSIVIAGVIFFGTWGLLKESVNLALQATPEGIDPAEVEKYLADLEGVTQVHDLHIWAMSTTETALTVHLVKPQIENDDPLLEEVCRELHNRFEITHATVQIERGTGATCGQAAPGSL
jgi:cobalt-zinc-cadmium efflux system protein